MINKFFAEVKIIRNIQLLFLVNAGVWLFLSIQYLLQNNLDKYLAISIMIFAEALLSVLLSYLLRLKKKFFYYLSIFYILGNIILTITDQIGIYDIITLVVFVIILVLLIINYKILTNNK